MAPSWLNAGNKKAISKVLTPQTLPEEEEEEEEGRETLRAFPEWREAMSPRETFGTTHHFSVVWLVVVLAAVAFVALEVSPRTV